jgi:AcrR family transcriptional regulator
LQNVTKKVQNRLMVSSPTDEPTLLSLRERKKAKTREAIQREALRLFSEHGYDETTIEQIAAAAEVSPSTFFRYFPTKEDVLVYDATDPLMFDSFRAQPADLSVLEAFRRSYRGVYGSLSPAELARESQRHALIRAVPALRARMVDEFVGTLQVTSEMIAERVHRSPEDLAVRTFAGAVIGAIIAVYLSTDETSTDPIELLDVSLTELEKGFKL